MSTTVTTILVIGIIVCFFVAGAFWD